MKTYLIVIAAFLLTAGVIVSACKKDEINGDPAKLILGSYITLDSTINPSLDVTDAGSTVAISVSEYGSAVESINIYLATGDNRTDSSTWVFIKNVPYTGEGTVLGVTTAEIAKALLPDSVVPGTQYTMENEVITKDGRRFSDVNTPDNYTSFAAYNFAFTWAATAVCPFIVDETVGEYSVVKDSWADYSPGDEITVSAGPGANQINFQGYPSPAFGNNTANTVVDVDPATGAATITKQATGDYDGTSAEVEGVGYVFSCTGGISLTMTVYYGGSPYKNQVFKLQKIQ